MPAWALIMGVTMYVQQKLNPQPPDPIQAKIFAWMPVIFTFMLASFPAGLVIYWSWNNLLSIAQQRYIMQLEAKRNTKSGSPPPAKQPAAKQPAAKQVAGPPPAAKPKKG
jgi:YidC/Oxa1 family membrane protein insertase